MPGVFAKQVNPSALYLNLILLLAEKVFNGFDQDGGYDNGGRDTDGRAGQAIRTNFFCW